MKSGERWLVSVAVIVLLAGSTFDLYEFAAPGTRPAPSQTTSKTSAKAITASSILSVGNSSAVEAVNGSFAEHMSLLAGRNASIIADGYEENATVTWTGQANGLAGLYSGTLNIRILLAASFSAPRSTSLAIGNETETALSVSPESAVVNSSFDFLGQSTIWGNFNGAVSAQDDFVYSSESGQWLISQEVWNFTSFIMQYPFGFVGCTGPSCPQSVQSMAISEDGEYLAAGTYEDSGYGTVYLVSMQGPAYDAVWRSVTLSTVIWSVAISANGSYVAAAGFANPGDRHGHGEVYLFNKDGTLLWNVSAGSEPRMVWVAISANGSRVAADYGSGIICLNTAGDVLWNDTFPQGGTSSSFAMSSDGGSLAYSDENLTLPGSASEGWGVFDLDSRGAQLWNYTEDTVGGGSYVAMSSDGSYLAAVRQQFQNGSVFYFDGRNGSVLWSYPYLTQNGIANFFSLVMSPDGSYVATGGPAGGVDVFNSRGETLWEGTAGGFGEPVLLIERDSIVVLYSLISFQFQAVDFKGTEVASSPINSVNGFASSTNGSVWVAAGSGLITNDGGCQMLDLYNGTVPLGSTQLCS